MDRLGLPTCRPGYMIHCPHMTTQRRQKPPRLTTPQLHFLVEGRRGKIATVGGEGDVVDGLLVAGKANQGLFVCREGVGERVYVYNRECTMS